MKRTKWLIVPVIAGGVAASCGKDSPPSSASGTEAESGITVDGSGTSDATVADDDDADETGDKLDVGTGMASGGNGDCMGGGGMMGENTFSIIWIANSPEGTVSKIDTKSGMELGRYYSGPTDGEDDPSRTSVNLEGDVAVSNRSGSVTKFASEEVRCLDANGNGTIETSNGPGNVLAFGEDECMLWHVQLEPDDDHRKGPRPTAWDAGSDGDPCNAGDDRLWLGWWRYSENVARFQRRAGADGALLDEVDVPGWDDQGNTDYGPYGGAVNAAGDLYVVGRNPGPLARIDAESLAVDRWEVPDGESPYGIAVDANGDVWMGDWNGGLLFFAAASETFTVIDTPNSGRARGLMADRDGNVWVASNNPCALIQADIATKTIVNDQIPLPNCDGPVGISIDAEGFVWVVDRTAELAFKVHPQSYATTTTTGLVGPYTYSDMTGAGLGLVVNPPQG
jgi:DNA-binding beta-propeller fold protein YncE